jgi:hypothetical protein
MYKNKNPVLYFQKFQNNAFQNFQFPPYTYYMPNPLYKF